MKHAGVYIHIPFCLSRCSYSDFATRMYEADMAERYVRAVSREIESSKNYADIDTIYFGGGTPSLLKSEQIERILQTVRGHFRVAPDAEVTMEMNPGGLS